jgi:mono/diheme cytochrome c family protein
MSATPTTRTGTLAAAALRIALMLCCTGLVAGRAKSQQTPEDQQFPQLIRSVAGPDLFRAYCASCHGSDAKGHGPAAVALRSKVPDLTALVASNNGQFPEALVRGTILGDDVVAAHGSRAMPIWGPIFHQVEEDVDKGNVRVENLIKYLESIQSGTLVPAPAKPVTRAPLSASDPVTGAKLYKQSCAACHGNDLKGNGPAPPPFDEWSPDLTTLAQRHGGQFPASYVADVLRVGVQIPAHGPAEMPIWGVTFKESQHLTDAQISARIADLVSYIRANQAE